MAGIGAAFAQKAPILLLLSGVASILFWVIETMWKSFQQAHYSRLREIEAYVRGDSAEIILLQINTSWYRAWRTDLRSTILQILLWPHVYLPHVCIGVGVPFLWLLNFAHTFVPR